jgi:hypothetical protein
MAKHLDRDDECPDFLYRLTPKEEKEVRAALPKGLPDLGRMEAVLAPPFAWGNSPWAWVLVAALFLPWVVLIPVLVERNPPKGEDAEREQMSARGIMIASGGVGAASLAVAGFLALRPWVKRGEQWVFFEEGVIRLSWGGKPLVFPWGEFKARKTITRPDGGQYEFAAEEVKPVRIWINRWVASRSLVDTLLDRHIVAVGPRVLRRIDAGESVKFGRFKVSKEGLSFKKELLPWDALDRVEADSTKEGQWHPRLVVYAGERRPWAQVDLADEGWNAWLMMWLVRKLKRGAVKNYEALRYVMA